MTAAVGPRVPDPAAVERLSGRLVDLHATLSPDDQRRLETLVWKAMPPLDRYELVGDRFFTVDELRLVADLDAAAPPAGAPADPQAAPATVIVKGTRRCNLRCTYCHDWSTAPDATMSFDTLAALVAGALRDPAHAAVEFIWHGGETTVLPIRWYERALALQARFRRPGQAVVNSIQTNATNLTPRWARFLRDNGFGVGVSLDGPAEVHDQTRVDAAGRPTYQRVRDGMALLDRYGITFGVLTVADREVVARGAAALLEFLDEAGVTNFGVLAAEPVNQPAAAPGTPVEHYTGPATMGRFLTELYDLLAERADGPRCRELTSIEQRVAGGDGGYCKVAGDCLGHYYMVEPTGEISHCDLFQGDDRYDFGRVGPRAFAAARRSLAMADRRRARQAEVEAMRSCPHFDVCQGWCPHETYLSVRHNPDHDAGCCGLAPVIEHIGLRVAQGSAVPVTVG